MHAMLQVPAQEIAFHPRQGRARGLDLGDDVEAITVFGDHLGDAADLALDTSHGGTGFLSLGLTHIYPHRVIDQYPYRVYMPSELFKLPETANEP